MVARVALACTISLLLVLAMAGVVLADSPTPIPTPTQCPTLTPIPTPTAAVTPTPLATPVFPTLEPPEVVIGEVSTTCPLTYSVYYYSQTQALYTLWISTSSGISQSLEGVGYLVGFLGLTETGALWTPGVFSGTTAYSATVTMAANLGEMFSWFRAAEQLGIAGLMIATLMVFLMWILFVLTLKVVIAIAWETFEVLRRLWEAIPFIG